MAKLTTKRLQKLITDYETATNAILAAIDDLPDLVAMEITEHHYDLHAALHAAYAFLKLVEEGTEYEVAVTAWAALTDDEVRGMKRNA